MVPIVFFGTHQFAATILEGLFRMPDVRVMLVLTQPDRPAGRGQEIRKSPVKIIAETFHIPVAQPASLKNYPLPVPQPFLGIAAQYGLLIPKQILDAFPKGVLNVHTSLLPKYRGASPIQTAIMNGDSETGVTIMKMDEGLDTGPLLLRKTLLIGDDDTAQEIEARLADLGVTALQEAIPAYVAGTISPTPQNERDASACRELTRGDGRVEWRKSSRDIYNQFRGLYPWPGIWTVWTGKRVKLLRIHPSDAVLPAGFVQTEKTRMFVGAGSGSIEILELQLEGARPQDAASFLRGHANILGAVLL